MFSILLYQKYGKHRFATVQAMHALHIEIYRISYQFWPIGIWENSPTFGYRHKENVQSEHRRSDFQVTYTIKDRKRYIPQPKNSQGQVVFLGGSYTFGVGSEDDATYSHLLATKYWKNWTIENRAVSGWGSLQAFLETESIVQDKVKPRLVIYSMISHHIVRNYKGKEFLQHIFRSRNQYPHFEIENGKPKLQKILTSVPKRAGTKQKQMLMTKAVISEMNSMYKQNGVHFVVALIPDKYNYPWPLWLVTFFHEEKIPYLDLTGIKIKAFLNDAHPNPEDHKNLANGIANSFVSEYLK